MFCVNCGFDFVDPFHLSLASLHFNATNDIWMLQSLWKPVKLCSVQFPKLGELGATKTSKVEEEETQKLRPQQIAQYPDQPSQPITHRSKYHTTPPYHTSPHYAVVHRTTAHGVVHTTV